MEHDYAAQLVNCQVRINLHILEARWKVYAVSNQGRRWKVFVLWHRLGLYREWDFQSSRIGESKQRESTCVPLCTSLMLTKLNSKSNSCQSQGHINRTIWKENWVSLISKHSHIFLQHHLDWVRWDTHTLFLLLISQDFPQSKRSFIQGLFRALMHRLRLYIHRCQVK